MKFMITISEAFPSLIHELTEMSPRSRSQRMAALAYLGLLTEKERMNPQLYTKQSDAGSLAEMHIGPNSAVSPSAEEYGEAVSIGIDVTSGLDDDDDDYGDV